MDERMYVEDIGRRKNVVEARGLRMRKRRRMRRRKVRGEMDG